MFSIMMVLILMVSHTSAYALRLRPEVPNTGFLQELAGRGEIHVDDRQPPPRPTLRLQRKQADNEETSTSTETEAAAATTSTSTEESASTTTESTTSARATTTQASTTPTKSSGSSSTASSGTIPSVTVVTTSLPSAFDTSLGSNFTKSTCPQFFTRFLSNSTFQACVPVSLFLQNSKSFFQVEQSAVLLAQTLDAACEAPLAVCMPLLQNMAAELIDEDNCGQDYSRQNPLVVQAYNGLVAYEPVYRATCLKNSETNNYCFSDAILNRTSPTDYYPYYTAVGMMLPPAVQPTCNQCLKDTMDIFASYASTDFQPLAKTYLACATQIDASCGSGFVKTDIKTGAIVSPASSSSGAPPSPRISMTTASITVLAAAVVALWTCF